MSLESHSQTRECHIKTTDAKKVRATSEAELADLRGALSAHGATPTSDNNAGYSKERAGQKDEDDKTRRGTADVGFIVVDVTGLLGRGKPWRNWSELVLLLGQLWWKFSADALA